MQTLACCPPPSAVDHGRSRLIDESATAQQDFTGRDLPVAIWNERENGMHLSKTLRTLATSSLAVGTIFVAASGIASARSGGFGGNVGNVHPAIGHDNQVGAKANNVTPRIARHVLRSSTHSVDRRGNQASNHPDKHKNKDSYKDSDRENQVARKLPLPGTGGTDNIHPVAGTPPLPGTGGTNNIHPIPNANSIYFANTVAGTTSLRTTHTSNNPPTTPNGTVNIQSSGGANSAIFNEGGGLTVTSNSPGTITITNSKGSSVTGGWKRD